MFDIVGTSVDLLSRENWVGIIGSRNASLEELKTAYLLAQRCVRKGKVVVSGLALGIDTEAHKGAIDAGGKTIAVVSTSEKQDIYPKENSQLALKIKECGSIIYPYKTVPKYEKGFSVFQKRLIERDILVAYLCPTIIVVKEDDTPIKGGSKWAMQYGKKYQKQLFRYDTNKVFHEAPEIEECKTWWVPELNIEAVDKYISSMTTK